MATTSQHESKSAMQSIWIVRGSVAAAAIASLAIYLSTTLPALGKTDFDDAYMFLRYARHYLASGEFSWNLGEGPAYGMTSLLHLFAVTALRGATALEDPLILTGLSFAAGLLALMVLLAAGFRLCNRSGLWLPLLLVPILLCSRIYPFHSLTGMETTTSLLINSLLVLVMAWHPGRFGKWQMIGCLVASYLACLARPDNGLYALLVPPLFYCACDSRNRKPALIYTGLFLALLGIDAILKKWLLGDFVPLPVYAKSSGFYRGYLGSDKWNAATFTFQFLRDCLPFLLLILGMANRDILRHLLALLFPMILTFGYYSTVNQIMGWNARYYFPSLPFVILGAFLALRSFEEKSFQPRPCCAEFWPARLVGMALLLVLSLSPSIETVVSDCWRTRVAESTVKYEPRTQWKIEAAEPLPRLGWVRAIHEVDALLGELPGEVMVAASENGFIGSRHPTKKIIDLAGLNDRQIAHEGFSAQALFTKNPDILWLPPPDYSYAVSEILDAAEFHANYDYFPGAFDYGLALRKNSKAYPLAAEALRKAFIKLYPGRDPLGYQARTLPG